LSDEKKIDISAKPFF